MGVGEDVGVGVGMGVGTIVGVGVGVGVGGGVGIIEKFGVSVVEVAIFRVAGFVVWVFPLTVQESNW